MDKSRKMENSEPRTEGRREFKRLGTLTRGRKGGVSGTTGLYVEKSYFYFDRRSSNSLFSLTRPPFLVGQGQDLI